MRYLSLLHRRPVLGTATSTRILRLGPASFVQQAVLAPRLGLGVIAALHSVARHHAVQNFAHGQIVSMNHAHACLVSIPAFLRSEIAVVVATVANSDLVLPRPADP
ncbi:hypothetical protein D3C71_1672310 [compost metagenome]